MGFRSIAAVEGRFTGETTRNARLTVRHVTRLSINAKSPIYPEKLHRPTCKTYMEPVNPESDPAQVLQAIPAVQPSNSDFAPNRSVYIPNTIAGSVCKIKMPPSNCNWIA